MKQNVTLLRLCMVLVAMGILGASPVFGQTLKHSYTFEDGTANDVVGGVNGTLIGGSISVADGMCTVEGATGNTDGYIDLDGVALNLNTYGAITLEALLYTQDLANTSFTMLAYFGNNTGGNKCLWIQPTRSATETRVEANNGTSSIVALLSGTEIDDGKPHHLTAVLTATDLTYYIDGVVAATVSTGGEDYISTLDTEIAHIFKGANGWADPNYNVSLDEFNIFDGEMDAATIKQRAGIFLGADFTNAKLDTLFADLGVMDPEFDADETDFELTLPYGVTQFTLTATPEVSLAQVSVYDGLGNEMPSDVITFEGDGIDLEIIVLATDGVTENTYYLSVFLEDESTSALLNDIQLSVGEFLTEFSPVDSGYKAKVPFGTSTVDVTPVPAGAGASVTGGGTLTLTDGAAFTTITVISEDEQDTMVYTVDVFETKVSVGNDYYIVNEYNDYVIQAAITGRAQTKLQAPLKDEASQVWQFEESGVEGQYYIKNQLDYYIINAPNTSNNWDLEIVDALPSVDLDSARFVLNEFEAGRFYIESVKRSQSSSPEKLMLGSNDGNLGTTVYGDKWFADSWNPYIVWNILPPDEVVDPYNTSLSALTVTPGKMSPDFDKAVTEYSLILDAGVTSVTIEATATDPAATVTGTGTLDVTAVEDSFVVTVTAPDAAYKSEYVIKYRVIEDVSLELKHSFTFADGTAKDVVGDANGVAFGAGQITEGVYIADSLGSYIEFPGAEIAINTFPSLTIELYLADDPNTTNANANTITSYFGNNNPDNTYGYDYLFTSVKSRAAMSCGNSTSPWGAESGADGANLHDDGAAHHIVTVVNTDSISFYIDGLLTSTAQLTSTNKIFNVSNELAYLCKSGYSGDNTWLGQVMEYNIYSGQMDAQEIALRSLDFPVEDATTDATLSALTVNGDSIEGFHPANLTYKVEVEDVPTVDGETKIASANYEVTQATEVPGFATVEVTAADGVTKNTYTIEFSAPDAAGDIKESIFKVYPTFTSGEFTVETQGNSTTISVYDMSGRMASQLQTTNTMERISLDQVGMYIVKVESEGSVELFKVFKNN